MAINISKCMLIAMFLPIFFLFQIMSVKYYWQDTGWKDCRCVWLQPLLSRGIKTIALLSRMSPP